MSTASADKRSQGLGIAAMSAAALLLTLNDAVTKLLTETYSVGQVLTLRQLCSLIVILPYVHFVSGWRALRINNRSGMAIRAVCFIATTGLIVYSFSRLPLALVTAIAFSSPIFVVALSRLFTNERVSARRWFAVLAGFAGVLVIVRPGTADFAPVLIFPVLAALSAGVRDVVTRALSRSDSSISILFWSTLAVVAASSLSLLEGWKPVSAPAAGLLVINGMLGGTAHFLIIEALRLGDASLVAPFRYTALIWATLLGFLIWGQLPDGWTLLGAVILVASGFYLIEREAGRTASRPEG